MAGPFCLVVNPAAGHGRSLRILPAVTAALDAAAATYHVTKSSSLDDARRMAGRAAQLGHVVVAVGGDGMAGALAGVVASTEGCFGIIAAGRGNDLARVLGIPADPVAATAVLTGGRTRLIDLIGVAAPGQAETIVAGSVYVGLPAVAGQIANQARLLAGPVVYPVAALRALVRWAPATFRAEIGDGTSSEVLAFIGYAVVVANVAYFGAGMQVAPRAKIDDGMLDIVIMRHGPKIAFLRVLMRIRDGSHVALPLISVQRGTEVTLTIDKDMPAAADGEDLACAAPLRAGTPLRIRALPGVLRVLAPDGGG